MAIKHYKLGLDLFQQIKDPQGQAESLYWLAKLFQEQGRLDEALTESQKSIDMIEVQRARVIGQNWRSSYFASVHRYFELQVDILMKMHWQKPDQGFAARALAASERARARSLLELLNETQSEIPRDIDPALLARERQLRQQLSAMGVHQITVLNGPRRETETAEIELKIRNLNIEYDVVQAQIKARSPVYSQLSQPAILNLKQIQAELRQDENTILIEYMLGDERSYAWLVTPTDLIVRELPGRRALEDLGREVYQSLSARQRQPDEDSGEYYNRYTAADERFCQSAPQLSQQLLGPFKSFLSEKRLLVVADGELLYIPFAALPLPAEDGAGGICRLDAESINYVPLLTAIEVVHLPSFSSLATLRQLSFSSSRPARELAVWADPVFESDDPRIPDYPRRTLDQRGTVIGTTPSPGSNAPVSVNSPPTRLLATHEEARSVMRFAPAGVSMLLTGFAANRESALNYDLQDYRILHFATHSTINSRYPSLTGLLLSTIDERGEAQNGLLQLHDIYGLRLNADLVVLSGCQTGLGKELSGEGLVGLTQGFLYAGSRSVVVSLWSVQDKTTANLMADFYQAMLDDGAAPAEALHQAKLKMYQQTVSRQPFYWSAFVIQGEYRAPPRSWSQIIQSRIFWSGLLLSGIVAWLLSFWWKSLRQRPQPYKWYDATFEVTQKMPLDSMPPENFELLLSWLGPDRDRAGEKYEQIRRNLLDYFRRRDVPDPLSLTDEVLLRVTRKVNTVAEGFVGDPSAYFMAVARRVLAEFRRRQVETELSGKHSGGFGLGSGRTQGTNAPKPGTVLGSALCFRTRDPLSLLCRDAIAETRRFSRVTCERNQSERECAQSHGPPAQKETEGLHR